MATTFMGQKRRVEFNGHDVTHLTGVSVGSMGKVFDTYQSLADPFDHDIEITEEASGSFDFISADAASGEQKFKEIMELTQGYIDLDITTTPTADTITPTDEDWTDLDTQGSYTGSRFASHYKRITEGDGYLDFDNDNDSVWIKFRAQGESINTFGFVWTYSGGVATNTTTIKADLFEDKSYGISSTATADSGSATTLVDSILVETDDYWNGASIKFTGGTNKGPTAAITDFVASSDTLTFNSQPEAISATTTYELSGAPSDDGVSGAAQHTITVDYDTFNGSIEWKSETAPATWTGLTIGKDYWIRLTRNTATGGFARLRTDATEASTYAGVWTREANATAESGAKEDVNVKESIHYIKFKQTEGLNVVVYDYTDGNELNGVKWTFNKVMIDSVTPSFATRQATRASVSWKCNDWSFDTI